MRGKVIVTDAELAESLSLRAAWAERVAAHVSPVSEWRVPWGVSPAETTFVGPDPVRECPT